MSFDCATMSKNFLIPLFGSSFTCWATLSLISPYYIKSAAVLGHRRRRVGGNSYSLSSLKFALSHREQVTVFSLPCLDKTLGY